MKPEHAQHLLDRFYRGRTSADEERTLREFLFSEACPAEMETDRAVLGALSVPADAEVPAGLEARIAAHLDRAAGKRRKPLWVRLTTLTGLAASVAALALGLYFHLHTPATVYADTCRSPQEAARETEAALLFISRQVRFDGNGEEDLGGPCP